MSTPIGLRVTARRVARTGKSASPAPVTGMPLLSQRWWVSPRCRRSPRWPPVPRRSTPASTGACRSWAGAWSRRSWWSPNRTGRRPASSRRPRPWRRSSPGPSPGSLAGRPQPLGGVRRRRAGNRPSRPFRSVPRRPWSPRPSAGRAGRGPVRPPGFSGSGGYGGRTRPSGPRSSTRGV